MTVHNQRAKRHRAAVFAIETRCWRATTSRVVVGAIVCCLFLASPLAADFIRPMKAGDPPIYGVRGGIVVAVYPAALDARPEGGPRGLLRVGYEENGKFTLINYIAVEPLVDGKRGLSELERSADGERGKQFRLSSQVDAQPVDADAIPPSELLTTEFGPALRFAIHVEEFANGARPIIEVTLHQQEPRRVCLRTFAAEKCAPLKECVLTATMGNQSRCRDLWLAERAESAHALFSDHRRNGFMERSLIPAAELHQTLAGDLVVAISPDEVEPSEVWPLPDGAWRHLGRWQAQFWLKRAGTWDSRVRCRTNGRRVYWGTKSPIPGGPAIENFELREPFQAGGEFWFGYCDESPHAEFGFAYDRPPCADVVREVPAAEAAVAARADREQRALKNGDFTQGLDGWIAEDGADQFLVYGGRGAGRLSSFGKKGDDNVGRLYQCFLVPDDALELRFFVHGGYDPGQLAIELWDGPRAHRRMTGRCDNLPFEVRWELTSLRGRIATLAIVDNLTTPWGFIGAHGFELQRAESGESLDRKTQ
ncbi:MAG: hypothetical protein ACKVX7_15710 [Planctomycetota bacterium]